jgi:hypothetical protein
MATNLDKLYFKITADGTVINDLNSIKHDGLYTSITVDPPGNFTLYQMESQMVKYYNTFLTEYSNCVSSTTPNNIQPIINCPDATGPLFQAQNMQAIIKKAVENIPSGSQIDKTSYDTSYNYILSNYNNLVDKRNLLDQQMKDIQKTSDSVHSMYKGSYDSSIYSQILLTVLATSVVYYIFVKL